MTTLLTVAFSALVTWTAVTLALAAVHKAAIRWHQAQNRAIHKVRVGLQAGRYSPLEALVLLEFNIHRPRPWYVRLSRAVAR